jgi:hypothetical protein
MSASQVHAVIAAGLKEPGLLARWKREPDLLWQCGVDPDAIDLEALLKFAGLTTKVRHNGLRGDIPLTFRLLNIAALEIEVFRAYAIFHAGKSFGATVQERIDDLLRFLEQWLDFDKREHALLWDLIRHEVALARLRKLDVFADAGAVIQHRVRASSVPRVRGEIILHEMKSDPRVVETLLSEKKPKLDQAPAGDFYFCYWRPNADDLYVLELDALGFYLLSAIDGKRSAAELSSLPGGTRKVRSGLLNSLAELAGVRIIALE